jgi:hypothetical protein
LQVALSAVTFILVIPIDINSGKHPHPPRSESIV